MNIRWIPNIVLPVTFLAMSGVVYGEGEQQCQPEVVVFFGNGVFYWGFIGDTSHLLSFPLLRPPS